MVTCLIVALALAPGLGCDKQSAESKASSERKTPPEVTPAQKAMHDRIAPPDWKPYTSQKCGYVVELPKAPKPSTLPAEVLDAMSYDGLQYGLASLCMDDIEESEEMLDLIAEMQKAEWPGASATVEPIEILGWPGRELELVVPADKKPPEFSHVDGDLRVRVRFYVVRGRAYLLQTLFPAVFLDEATERFFASFRLLDATPRAGEPAK